MHRRRELQERAAGSRSPSPSMHDTHLYFFKALHFAFSLATELNMQVLYNEECHAECSSMARTRQLEYHSSQTTVHDIFLSHSGKQKGVAKDLHRILHPFYITFFDIKAHSLPAGGHFPSKIFKAAETCKVAVVVLSDDFICSKWPMIELCVFVDRLSKNNIHILPLFYQLQPGDLTLQKNLKRWKEKWKVYAEQGGKYSLTVAKCVDALRALCPINGLIYDPLEGVLDYFDKIKSTISRLVSPTITLDEHLLYGKHRLCKVILDRFEDMVQHLKHSKALVMGLFGPPESGKSILSLLLRDHLSRQYTKVLHLKLANDRDSTYQDELLKIFKELLCLTDFQNHVDVDKISELRDVINLLKRFNFPSLSVCLVIDNVHERSVKAVEEILKLGVGPGSKVILVSQSHDVLQPVLRMQGDRYMFDCVSMPSLTETEAHELLLHYVGALLGLDECKTEDLLTDRHREIALGIVQTCGLGSKDSLSYRPGPVKKIAEEMVLRQRELVEGREHKFRRLLEDQVTLRIQDCTLPGVREFVLDSFNALPDDEHRILFLDIALFILPANIQSMERACEVLSLMHECSPAELEEKIKVLELYDFVKTSLSGFSIHEVHAHFAASCIETEAWKIIKHVVVESSRMSLRETYKDVELRTLMIDDVECKEIDLWHLYGLKAFIVRNCKSLELVKFTGTSYISWSSSCLRFSIKNCPSLWWVSMPMDVRFTGQGTTLKSEYISLLLSIFSAKLSYFLYNETHQIFSPARPLFGLLFLSLFLAYIYNMCCHVFPCLPISLFLIFYIISHSPSLSTFFFFVDSIKRELVVALFLILTRTDLQYYFYRGSHSFVSLAFSFSLAFFLFLSLAFFPVSLSSFFGALFLFSMCHLVWLGFVLLVGFKKLLMCNR